MFVALRRISVMCVIQAYRHSCPSLGCYKWLCGVCSSIYSFLNPGATADHHQQNLFTNVHDFPDDMHADTQQRLTCTREGGGTWQDRHRCLATLISKPGVTWQAWHPPPDTSIMNASHRYYLGHSDGGGGPRLGRGSVSAYRWGPHLSQLFLPSPIAIHSTNSQGRDNPGSLLKKENVRTVACSFLW